MIPVDFRNTVIWMIFILPQIFPNSYNSFAKFFGMVPDTAIIMATTVTFRFDNVIVLLQVQDIFSSFSLSVKTKSFFPGLSMFLSFILELDDPFTFQGLIKLYIYSLELLLINPYTIHLHGQILVVCTFLTGFPILPTHKHSLITWLTVSSHSHYIWYLLFCCVMS